MSYEPVDASRSLRGPERERMLLAEAERLIEARAAKLHVSPRAVANAIFPAEAEAVPTREEQERKATVGELLRRLAVRDQGSDAVD